MKIAGLGNALIDILAILPSEEAAQEAKLIKGGMELIGEDRLKKLNAWLSNFETLLTGGGSAANTMAGLGRLGIPCGFIGKTGSDDYGKFYKEDLIRNGVTPRLFRGDKPTGCAVTLITPDGERSFGTYLGAAATLSAAELNPDIFTGYDLLHLEGYLVQSPPLIRKAVRLAKERGLKISLDLSSYNVVKNQVTLFHELLTYTDIVFGNEKEISACTGCPPEDGASLLSRRTGIVVLKKGAEGSLIYSGKKIYRIGVAPATRTDTTGAGDLYAAGFLYGISEKYPLQDCGELGAVLAAGVIGNIGPRMNDDQWDKIKLKVRTLFGSSGTD